MPGKPPNIRHERYNGLTTTEEIDAQLEELTRILHATTSIKMVCVIRGDQDYLLDLRNRLVRKTKRGTRIPRDAAA